MAVFTPESSIGFSSVELKSRISQFERYDTIDTPKIVVLGISSSILLFVIVLAAQAVFFAADHQETYRKATSGLLSALTENLTQQQNQLSGYGWVDPPKGLVRIPINDAMRIVVGEQRSAQSVKEIASL